jgi:hypothetical protein
MSAMRCLHLRGHPSASSAASHLRPAPTLRPQSSDDKRCATLHKSPRHSRVEEHRAQCWVWLLFSVNFTWRLPDSTQLRHSLRTGRHVPANQEAHATEGSSLQAWLPVIKLAKQAPRSSSHAMHRRPRRSELASPRTSSRSVRPRGRQALARWRQRRCATRVPRCSRGSGRRACGGRGAEWTSSTRRRGPRRPRCCHGAAKTTMAGPSSRPLVSMARQSDSSRDFYMPHLCKLISKLDS